MHTFYVCLSSVDDVKRFVCTASEYNCRIEVSSGRYTVNAKSITGLFTLDLTKPVQVKVYGTEEEVNFKAQILNLVVPGYPHAR